MVDQGDDLTERLRAEGTPLAIEAALEIEKLRAEAEAARRTVDNLHDMALKIARYATKDTAEDRDLADPPD